MQYLLLSAAGVLCLIAAGTGVADDATDPHGADAVKRFVGCPVYRDTDAGRKSGCWLVTDPEDGIEYDVTQGRIKPILGRRILVEGLVKSSGQELCGGTVLLPVNVSVLQEECPRYLIPAEGYPGRRFVLPARVMQPASVPRTLPPPPYGPREFVIEFELDSDFLVYQYAELILEDASLYIKASQPRNVTITGYAATDPIQVSGRSVHEIPAVAEARALMVAEALVRLGVPRDTLHLDWRAAPPDGFKPDSGLTQAARRRATISITP